MAGYGSPVAPGDNSAMGPQLNMNQQYAIRRLQKQQQYQGKQPPPGRVQAPLKPLPLKRY